MASEEYSSENSFIIGLGNDFLGMTPKAQTTKAKINKGDYIKLTSSAQQKKQSLEWEKVFTNHISDKGLILEIYKELIQHNNNKQTNNLSKHNQITQLRNRQKTLINFL